MTYKLSQASLDKLVGVHPHLVRVVRRAIEISAVDFRVLEGVRSRDQAARNWGKGRSTAQCLAKGISASYARPTEPRVTALRDPFSSKHLTGRAVDLLPLPVDWNNLEPFREVARAMQVAATELGIRVSSGAMWKSFPDFPHHELL